MTEDPPARDPARVVRAWVAELRADERRRWAAIVVATLVGLVLAWFHWVGLVVGGALVSLPARDGTRAVAAAIAFGIVALVAFVLVTPTASVGELLALESPVYVAIGSALVLPLLGSLARGVV